LTEEVLGASLVWFDKRVIFERTGRWPGVAERHGNAALVDLALEKAGLMECVPAVQWAEGLYNQWLAEGRPVEVGIYESCPCGSGSKLKFCHREPFRDFIKALTRPTLRASPGAKEP
jgi:hypothetical protein